VRRGARRALGIGAALVVLAASGARAEVRPICSSGCVSVTLDNADSEQDGADATLSMTLIGGGRTRGDGNPELPPLLFDREAVPTVLASGLASALTPSRGLASTSPYVDFERLLKHPNQIDAPAEIARALFLSVPSLVGELTFGDILSDGAAYFASQNPATSSGRLPIGPGDVVASHGPSKDTRFSTGDSEATPAKAAHSTFSWIASSFDSSQ
jgi:hypothetical protein